MEVKLNRTCKVNGGNTIYKEGDVISSPDCVVDILLKLGYADIVEPVVQVQEPEIEKSEE